jgi:hypothetical protein
MDFSPDSPRLCAATARTKLDSRGLADCREQAALMMVLPRTFDRSFDP